MNSFVDNIRIIIALIIAMIHLRLSKINDVYSIWVYYRQHNTLILTSLLDTLGYHTLRYVDTNGFKCRTHPNSAGDRRP